MHVLTNESLTFIFARYENCPGWHLDAQTNLTYSIELADYEVGAKLANSSRLPARFTSIKRNQRNQSR